MNAFSLFRMVFVYQGMSFLAFLCHRRNWSRAVWIIVTVLLMLTSVGTSALYIVGLIDGIFGLKGRLESR